MNPYDPDMDRYIHAPDPATGLAFLWRRLAALAALLLGLGLALWPDFARAAPGEIDITLQARHWIDPSGSLDVDEVARRPVEDFAAMERYRSFRLDGGVLWLRLELPERDAARRWYLTLSAAAFTNRATLYTAGPSGAWTSQQAGDHLPVSQWAHPDQTPVFVLDSQAAGPVWLRLENQPAPVSPRLIVLDERQLQETRQWTFLMVGGYLGFGLLVLFIGWVHARLYADRAFIAYCCYVACMLGFQAAFTGVGGLFFWPDHAAWNDAAPPVFMLWLTASGIWFVREVCMVSRHHRGVDRLVLAWSVFGLLFPVLYLLLLYSAGLHPAQSLRLAVGVAELQPVHGPGAAARPTRWMALGSAGAPGLPLPGVAHGLLPDSWATQYCCVDGSAIEIPLLLIVFPPRQGLQREPRARVARDREHRPAGRPSRRCCICGCAMRCAVPGVTTTGVVWCWWSSPTTLPSWDRGGARRGRGNARWWWPLAPVGRGARCGHGLSHRRDAVRGLVEGPEDLRLLGQHIVAKGRAAPFAAL